MKLSLQHALIVENNPQILRGGLSPVQIVRELTYFFEIDVVSSLLFYLQSGDQGRAIYQLQLLHHL